MEPSYIGKFRSPLRLAFDTYFHVVLIFGLLVREPNHSIQGVSGYHDGQITQYTEQAERTLKVQLTTVMVAFSDNLYSIYTPSTKFSTEP